MSNIKSWAVALVLATGGFWFVMVKDPPKSVAADPSATFSSLDLNIPSDLTSAEGGNAH